MPPRDDVAVIGYLAGRFESGVILPIAGLVMAAMLTLAAVVWWTATQADRIALRDEARLLATGLAARLDAEAGKLFDYVVWDEAYEKLHLERDPTWAVDNIGRWAHERLGVAMSFVVDPEGRTWFGMIDGEVSDREAAAVLGEAVASHVSSVQRAASEQPRAAFFAVGDRVAVVTAGIVGTHTDGPRRRPGPPSAVVQVDFLDREDLAELARTYLLPELRLELGRPPAGSPAVAADPAGMPFPLRGAEGDPIAALTWRSAAPGADLLARVLPVLGLATLALAALALVVLRHARASAIAIAASEGRATRDPLTGLPNRRLLDDRIAAALTRLPREGGRAALLYVDLDGFKPVNDRHGHAAGDRLLCEVGRRLVACARETDTVARLGGDEFVVLQVGGAQPDGALRVAEAVLAALGRPVTLDSGAEVGVGASIGIALAPDHAADPHGLARRADAALYAAKASGRGTYRLFGQPGVEGRPDDEAPARPAATRPPAAPYPPPAPRANPAGLPRPVPLAAP